jgi:AraC-like DNA-binding protein
MGRTSPKPAIRSYAFKAGLPHELEIIPLSESLARAREMITAPHRTDFHQIVWLSKGKATLLVDMRAIPMEAGSLLFIRKDRILRYDRTGSYDGKVLLFTDRFFIRNPEDAAFLQDGRLTTLSNEHPVADFPPKDNAVAGILALLESELANKPDPQQAAVLQNLLHTLLLLADRKAKAAPRRAATGPAEQDFLNAFVAKVDADFRKEKRVSAYAESLGVTGKRLLEASAKRLGKKPKAVIDERVSLEAKRMLLFSGASVKEIAFDLGFEEVTNFVKWFRKQAKTTPADFRLRYRG